MFLQSKKVVLLSNSRFNVVYYVMLSMGVLIAMWCGQGYGQAEISEIR